MRGSKALSTPVGYTLRERQFEDRPFVFESLRNPKFPRASEKRHRVSKSFVIASDRLPALGCILGQEELALFEIVDTGFVGFDNGLALRIDDAIEQLLYLSIDLRNFCGHRFAALGSGCQTLLPQITEDMLSETGQLLRWRQLPQKLLEGILHRAPPDRLCLAGAALGAAQVVGIKLAVATLRPVGCEGLVAV